ncbi:hypothetical protein ACFLZZ_00885 [Nanoarchaeota archaeon]
MEIKFTHYTDKKTGDKKLYGRVLKGEFVGNKQLVATCKRIEDKIVVLDPKSKPVREYNTSTHTLKDAIMLAEERYRRPILAYERNKSRRMLN